MGSIMGFHASFDLHAEALGFLTGVIFSGCALVPGPSSSSPFGIRCLFCLTKVRVHGVLVFTPPSRLPLTPPCPQPRYSNTDVPRPPLLTRMQLTPRLHLLLKPSPVPALLFAHPQSERAGLAITGFTAKHDPHGALAPVFRDQLTHDKEELDFIGTDPHHNRGPLQNRTGLNILKAVILVKQRLPTYTVPFIAIHGAADTVCYPAGSEMLFRNAASSDKTLRLYPNLYHEILLEVPKDRAMVVAEVLDFIKTRSEKSALALINGTGV